MSIEERILNDNSCSPYVDKGRGYIEIAFIDGAYWGYEQGSKDMIERVLDFMRTFQNGNGEFPLYDYIGNVRKAMED